MVQHNESQHLDVSSRIALAGHPVHAMLVNFPISLAIGTLGSDIFYWLTADPFFARLALWTAGWGFVMGVLAGVAGVIELLAGAGIRRRAESWTHAIAAVMLLGIIGTNWGIRLLDASAAVLPWGLLLSLLGAVFVGLAGWHGGKLVFEHGVGLTVSDDLEVPARSAMRGKDQAEGQVSTAPTQGL